MSRYRIDFRKPADPFQARPIRTLITDCYHCMRTTSHVLDTVEDAETAAWRERYERLLGELNSAVALCRLKHGTDPMYEEFMAMMLKIRDKLGIKEQGEEWKS